MIVSFSVENFRSIAAEQTLNLVASNRFSDCTGEHFASIPGTGERVLRVAVLYGANGAGKSNLFLALKYLRKIALETRPKNAGTGRESFRFGDPEPLAPSSFDLQFIVKGQLYRFGFVVDDQRFLEEWLIKVEGTQERPLYERTQDEQGEFVIKKTEYLKASGDRLLALATVGGPQNQSFLATIRATLEPVHYGDELRDIFDWLRGGLMMVGPDEEVAPVANMLADEPEFRQFASQFLKAASTGVDHLEVTKREVDEEQLRQMFPSSFLDLVAKEQNDSPTIFRLGKTLDLLVEPGTPPKYFVVTVQAAHEHQPGRVVHLNLPEESDGTRRLLELLPAMYYLRGHGSVYFIDEIDRSMHPMLVWKYIDFFLKSRPASQSQIILTTHESNLLDLDLLRRDEIWFAEKDGAGASHFYSLADFKVRNDLQIRKHYLQGRFGAVPFLGNLGRLLPAPADLHESTPQPA